MPLRRIISGTRRDRGLTILYIFVGHMYTVNPGRIDLGLDPRGDPQDQKTGYTKGLCEGVSFTITQAV